MLKNNNANSLFLLPLSNLPSPPESSAPSLLRIVLSMAALNNDEADLVPPIDIDTWFVRPMNRLLRSDDPHEPRLYGPITMILAGIFLGSRYWIIKPQVALRPIQDDIDVDDLSVDSSGVPVQSNRSRSQQPDFAVATGTEEPTEDIHHLYIEVKTKSNRVIGGHRYQDQILGYMEAVIDRISPSMTEDVIFWLIDGEKTYEWRLRRDTTFLDARSILNQASNDVPRDSPPHVTWCPTGALSFLPLHAAGDYSRPRSKAFDWYTISSYTPTTAVLDAMEQHDWIHLACHAHQNVDDPTKRFFLNDGTLDLASINRRLFKNKGLAFLFACQTATGDEKLADEAVHLASGMLMAGYPGVIAMMWSVSDKGTLFVADKVYAQLVKGGRV
ncbi:CHAT domain-containing protein [Rhizoctonia solani]|nr:CHAT domain-containing protein [Rhizoctonia solani]